MEEEEEVITVKNFHNQKLKLKVFGYIFGSLEGPRECFQVCITRD